MRKYLALLALLAPAACGSPAVEPDATVTPPADAQILDDGPPVRRPCTGSFGDALTTQHGRLDGVLVSIVPPGNGGCNADADHLHLQVETDGATYDVAINVSDPQNVYYLALDHALPDGAWSEGWHADQVALLDYPTTLGVHAAAFAPMTKSALTAAIQAELADANHVSVFMSGYGPDGGDYVHRRGSGRDGAIVVKPLGPPRLLLFKFADQNF